MTIKWNPESVDVLSMELEKEKREVVLYEFSALLYNYICQIYQKSSSVIPPENNQSGGKA